MAELEQLSAPLAFIKQKKAIEQDALEQLVDLYCAKDAALEPMRAQYKILEKDLKDVEEQLQAALDENHKPEDDGIAKTDDWMLQFGAKGKTTEILDKKVILDMLGEELFLSIVTVSITELKKYLTPVQLKTVAKEVHKHKRKLTPAKVGQ